MDKIGYVKEVGLSDKPCNRSNVSRIQGELMAGMDARFDCPACGAGVSMHIEIGQKAGGEISMPIEFAEMICKMEEVCFGEGIGPDNAELMAWIKENYPELNEKYRLALDV